jgi:hypothetical protein
VGLRFAVQFGGDVSTLPFNSNTKVTVKVFCFNPLQPTKPESGCLSVFY